MSIPCRFLEYKLKFLPYSLNGKHPKVAVYHQYGQLRLNKNNAKQLTFSVKIKSSRFSWISITFEIKIVKDRSMQ